MHKNTRLLFVCKIVLRGCTRLFSLSQYPFTKPHRKNIPRYFDKGVNFAMVIAEKKGVMMIEIREQGAETLRSQYTALPTIAQAVAQPGKIGDPFLACAVSSVILSHSYLKQIHGMYKEDVPNFLNGGYVTITYSQHKGPAVAEICWLTKRREEDTEEGDEPFSSSIPIRIILRRIPFGKGGARYLQLSVAAFSRYSGQWHEHGIS